MKEPNLRESIENFYLNEKLINTIFKLGFIPYSSLECVVGVAFVDIVDYSFISKFLSPMENQTVIDGLFSAFNLVLEKHNAYLNKMEGDSIMFHFGGLVDSVTRDLPNNEAFDYIARELFYTCVDIQEACFKFNMADFSLADDSSDNKVKEDIKKAFDILNDLRLSFELAYSTNAFYNIQVRVGASIGYAIMGNFGVPGAKQWDIIGNPVIEAKRMESSAPIGGLRISKKYFSLLEKIGVVKDYYNRFVDEAHTMMGYFKDIKLEDLFKYKLVCIKDKKNAFFETFSVQINPALPEIVSSSVNRFLGKGRLGADRIVELLKYYRGNSFVINAIESVFIQRGCPLRKGEMLKIIFPNCYDKFVKEEGAENAEKKIAASYSLFDIFRKLGEYQDHIDLFPSKKYEDVKFLSYSQYMADNESIFKEKYEAYQSHSYYKNNFDFVFSLFFAGIKASILEYQNNSDESNIETLEEI